MKKYKVSLKAARVNAELTQREAAKRIGVAPTTLNYWENGKIINIPNPKIMKVCEVYKIPIDCLFLPSQ